MKKSKGLNQYILPVIIIAGLLIARNFMSDKVDQPSNDNGEGKDVPDEDTTTPDPDLYKDVKVGSKGVAVKKVQERCNTIIWIVKKDIKAIENSNLSSQIKLLAKRISNLKGLKVDGIYGPKTKEVVVTITGNELTNLHTCRKKYSNWKYLIGTVSNSSIDQQQQENKPWYSIFFHP